jgi:Tfp pilus assembly protein PilN
MINLLPTDLKEQIYFAKLNRKAVGYLKLSILVVIVLGVLFGGSLVFLDSQSIKIAKEVAKTEIEIAATQPFRTEAIGVSARINSIKEIQATQTRFSILLDDIAQILPAGVSIDSISLTGNDKTPVKLSVTGGTYESVLELRDALVTSARISGADIENISKSGTTYTGSVVIGFKPGQAK